MQMISLEPPTEVIFDCTWLQQSCEFTLVPHVYKQGSCTDNRRHPFDKDTYLVGSQTSYSRLRECQVGPSTLALLPSHKELTRLFTPRTRSLEQTTRRLLVLVLVDQNLRVLDLFLPLVHIRVHARSCSSNDNKKSTASTVRGDGDAPSITCTGPTMQDL